MSRCNIGGFYMLIYVYLPFPHCHGLKVKAKQENQWWSLGNRKENKSEYIKMQSSLPVKKKKKKHLLVKWHLATGDLQSSHKSEAYAWHYSKNSQEIAWCIKMKKIKVCKWEKRMDQEKYMNSPK